LLDFGNATVLTDPWFSEKFHYHHGEPLGIPLARLPRLTAVVASHEHYDNLAIETFAGYPDKAVPFFVGPNMVEAARAAGFTNVRELSPWDSATVGPLTITAAPAAHKVPEVTFVILANGSTICFGGDTRLILELDELPKRFPPVKLAQLAVNGMSVLGEQAVMNAEQATRSPGGSVRRWPCRSTTVFMAAGSPTALSCPTTARRSVLPPPSRPARPRQRA
jgi:L-ascorbate metabolism protein UlaG (beta-lactamase superfamily)